MRYIGIVLFFIVCGLAANSFAADANLPDIVFEVYNAPVEMRPFDVNDMIEVFNDANEVESTTVLVAENLNRWNAFHKVDSEVGYRVCFDFYADIDGKWQFDFVYDAGIASCLLIDQNEIFFCDLDRWVGINKPIVKKVNLKQGWHRFEFLALETCCGSPMRIRVKKPDMKEFEAVSGKVLQLRSLYK